MHVYRTVCMLALPICMFIEPCACLRVHVYRTVCMLALPICMFIEPCACLRSQYACLSNRVRACACMFIEPCACLRFQFACFLNGLRACACMFIVPSACLRLHVYRTVCVLRTTLPNTRARFLAMCVLWACAPNVQVCRSVCVLWPTCGDASFWLVRALRAMSRNGPGCLPTRVFHRLIYASISTISTSYVSAGEAAVESATCCTRRSWTSSL